MVLLDALHTKDHVLAELRDYRSMVNVGSYVIASRRRSQWPPDIAGLRSGDARGHRSLSRRKWGFRSRPFTRTFIVYLLS